MERFPLPPPVYGAASKPSRATSFQQNSSSYYEPTGYGAASKQSRATSFQQSSASLYESSASPDASPSAPTTTYEHQVCEVFQLQFSKSGTWAYSNFSFICDSQIVL